MWCWYIKGILSVDVCVISLMIFQERMNVLFLLILFINEVQINQMKVFNLMFLFFVMSLIMYRYYDLLNSFVIIRLVFNC